MTESAIRHREAQRAYVRTDKGQARLQRVNEERVEGYRLLRAQGVPREGCTTSRCRRALREYLEQLQREASNEAARECG